MVDAAAMAARASRCTSAIGCVMAMLFFIEKHKPARTVSGGLVMSASCQDSLGNKSDLLEQVDEAITITYSEVSQNLTVELDTMLDHRSDES